MRIALAVLLTGAAGITHAATLALEHAANHLDPTDIDSRLAAGDPTPTVNHYETCPRPGCYSDWHGLPRGNCPGSHTHHLD